MFTNVPEAAGYNLAYTLPIPNSAAFNAGTVPYTVNNAASIPRGSFDRVAYYLEVQGTAAGSPLQYVYVSTNAFTDDARRIGVPNLSGGFFQRPLAAANVVSNVGGIATGTNLSGFNMEFWRTNYAQANAAAVPNASGSTYDTGDQPTAGGYGSMQIHNSTANQPVFSYNRWGGSDVGVSNLGIGVNTGTNPDYTFQVNADGFAVKNLQVLVRPTPTLQTHRLQIMPLGDSITFGSGALGGYRTRLQQRLATAGIDFEFVGSQVDNASVALSATGRVTHEGHGGYRIDQISSGLDSGGTGGTDNNGFWFNPTIQPDIILLHIGTNDFGQGFNTTTAKDRLDALITKLTTQRPNAKVIVTNLMERGEPYNTQIQQQFNPFVPGIVDQHRQNGEQVFFLDMRSVVPLSDMPDQLHPNQTGYDKMGDAWFNAIQAIPEPGAIAIAAPLLGMFLARRRRSAVAR